MWHIWRALTKNWNALQHIREVCAFPGYVPISGAFGSLQDRTVASVQTARTTQTSGVTYVAFPVATESHLLRDLGIFASKTLDNNETKKPPLNIGILGNCRTPVKVMRMGFRYRIKLNVTPAELRETKIIFIFSVGDIELHRVPYTFLVQQYLIFDCNFGPEQMPTRCGFRARGGHQLVDGYVIPYHVLDRFTVPIGTHDIQLTAQVHVEGVQDKREANVQVLEYEHLPTRQSVEDMV